MSAIRFDKVSHKFDDRTIVSNLSLDIECGDFVSIVGSSGSGKTTLMKMINGLITPDHGTVYVDGTAVSEMDVVELRRGIGYSIQGNVLFPHLTIEENIGYVLSLKGLGRDQIAARVTDLLHTFQLPDDIRQRVPSQISGGQAQRVGIARAYAAEANILLMDEPFGAVDAITRYQLQEDLQRWHETLGLTIVFITHDIREALKMSNKILVLHEGKVQQYATREEILRNPAVGFVEDLVRMSH